jgi:hypothetical protein
VLPEQRKRLERNFLPSPGSSLFDPHASDNVTIGKTHREPLEVNAGWLSPIWSLVLENVCPIIADAGRMQDYHAGFVPAGLSPTILYVDAIKAKVNVMEETPLRDRRWRKAGKAGLQMISSSMKRGSHRPSEYEEHREASRYAASLSGPFAQMADVTITAALR